MARPDQLLDDICRMAAADTMGLTWFGTHCVDCGVNTAPAIWCGREVEPALPGSWVWVKDKVWAAAGMRELDGSLCVGCIEARLGRRLRRKDFDFTRSENQVHATWITPRLTSRRGA